MPTRRKKIGRQNKSNRTRSKSRSPTSLKTPLTEDEFRQKLDDLAKDVDDSKFQEELNDAFVNSVNETLMMNYRHFFKFNKEYERTFNGIITKQDVGRIKEQLGKRHKNIEKASYNWQMFLFEVIKIIKDVEISLAIERYTWDAGLIVLYAAYPDYLNHKNEDGQKDVLSGYVPYRQITPLFPK